MAPPIRKPVTQKTTARFTVSAGTSRNGFKIGIYGPEGIGKSSLAALCPGVVFADIEGSMADINCKKVDELNLHCAKFAGNWELLRAWIQSLSGSIIAGIDSVTRAEDWAAAYVIGTKKSNDGAKADDSLEDFKYKAGLTFCVDEFKKLLADIDAARRRGVSFIMVAHSRIAKTKNPDGSDFVRTEPRLIDDAKGSSMLQWIQFLDHLACVQFDIAVTKGKAEGSGTRTIYLDPAPSRMAKCRGIDNASIDFTPGNDELWRRLGVVQ